MEYKRRLKNVSRQLCDHFDKIAGFKVLLTVLLAFTLIGNSATSENTMAVTFVSS